MKITTLTEITPKTILFFILLVVLAYILSLNIVRSEILNIIIILSTVLGIFLFLNIRINYYFLLGYTVIIGILKRLTFVSGEIIKYNPIILIPSIFSILLAMNILLFYERHIIYYIKKNRLSQIITILFFLLTLQIFNPIQGGILVGLSGTIFMLLPMLWFFFALLIDRNESLRLIKFIIHLGFLTGLFGIYQHYFGIFEFDEIWIKESGLLMYLKENVPRAFSTFTSSGDFAFFMEYSGVLAFFFFVFYKKLYYLLVTLITVLGIYFSGTRSALLGLLYSIIVFFIMAGTNQRRNFERFIIITIILLTIYTVLPERIQSVQHLHPGERTFMQHTIVGVLNPMGEKSLQGRVEQWQYVMSSLFTKWPFGAGIGAGTISSIKFGGEFIYNDSAFFAVAIAGGIIGLILISLVYYHVTKYSFYLCLNRKEDNFMNRLLIGYMMGQLLTGIFGVNFAFYTLAPFFWLFTGILVKEYIIFTQANRVEKT